MKFRHELKYEIDNCQLETLKNDLSQIMDIDSNVKNSTHMYHIKSVYFDDMFNTCYYENENGIDPREKFRIRMYDDNTDYINLELKKKNNNLTSKQNSLISYAEAKDIIFNNNVIISMDPLINKFSIYQQTKLLEPKVIVEYDRIPFVCVDGNVRVTFDINIKSSSNINRFFEKDTYARSIMPKGKNILEVKYDEFLPKYIYDIIQYGNLKQVTFSKYYLCRKFGGIK